MSAEGREQGSTLVELLVVMVLTTVVLAAVGTVFVSTTRGVRETQVRTSTQADARTAMEAMSRSLRVAVAPPRGAPTGPSSGSPVPGPFTSASRSSVTFYANLQRAALTFSTTGPTSAPVVRADLQVPSLVTFAYDASRRCITETRTPATVNTAANAATVPYLWTSGSATKCLAATTTPPAFTYFTSGVIAAGGATPAPIAQPSSTSPLSPAEAGTVVSVGISLTVVDPDAVDVPPTNTTDRVTLVNVLASQAG